MLLRSCRLPFLPAMRRIAAVSLACLATVVCSGGGRALSDQASADTQKQAPVAESKAPKKTPPAAASAAKKDRWKDLFDGRSLTGWKVTQFGGEGEVHVEKGQLMLEFGSPLTGVTYTGKYPKSNYELRLEAMRVDGSDFFCALTFPVGDSSCSFIVGGWGGGVIGLSSIDGRDASENETTDYMRFVSKKWYRIRVRVTDTRIKAWIDDKQKVDQVITGHTVDTRPEVDLSKPLGIASYDTRAALRKIQIRPLGKPNGPKPGNSGAPK